MISKADIEFLHEHCPLDKGDFIKILALSDGEKPDVIAAVDAMHRVDVYLFQGRGEGVWPKYSQFNSDADRQDYAFDCLQRLQGNLWIHIDNYLDILKGHEAFYAVGNAVELYQHRISQSFECSSQHPDERKLNEKLERSRRLFGVLDKARSVLGVGAFQVPDFSDCDEIDELAFDGGEPTNNVVYLGRA